MDGHKEKSARESIIDPTIQAVLADARRKVEIVGLNSGKRQSSPRKMRVEAADVQQTLNLKPTTKARWGTYWSLSRNPSINA